MIAEVIEGGDLVMLRRLAVMSAMMVMLSGCYMIPMAFIGPATTGFSTASIIQSTVTTSASYMIKKSTGKTISQHALDALQIGTLQQTYFPKNNKNSFADPL